MRHAPKKTQTPPKTKRPRRIRDAKAPSSSDDDPRIAELLRRGILTRGEPGLLEELLTPGPPAPDALKALRKVRDSR
ncbi:MAG TPA: hypothetical protein VFF73_17355 [Planctomycetota bacterium]|nr:hypothetical protein [Planctomycetota bacterium]